jgi:hypothetical protein
VIGTFRYSGVLKNHVSSMGPLGFEPRTYGL